jgi:N-acetyltransferase
MNFEQTYVLENEFVILRPLQEADFEHLIGFSMNEPELWKYSLMPGNGEDNLRKYIQSALDQRKAGTAYPFIIYDKNTKRYAGSTRFYDFQSVHQTTQLGFTWIGSDFQGKGINKQCKYLMLSFAFEQLQLARVEFRADYNNKLSIAAMKSIGCVEEGVLRSNCSSPTGRRDSIVLSILADEWKQSVKTKLENKIKFSQSKSL